MINKLGRKVLSSTVNGTIATVVKARAIDHMRYEFGDADPVFELLANVARNRAEAKEIATICPRIMKRATFPRIAG